MVLLYELAEEGQSVANKSFRLPIFEAGVDSSTVRVIIDTGATMIYISQRFVYKIGPKVERFLLVRFELQIRIFS